MWNKDNLNDADDDDEEEEEEEEEDDYYDENNIDVALVVQLLHSRDFTQTGRQAGKQTASPEGIPALSGCHYLSVSISPSTGLAYR